MEKIENKRIGWKGKQWGELFGLGITALRHVASG